MVLWKVADAAVQLRRLVVMAVVEREEYPAHDAIWTPASGGTSICHAKLGSSASPCSLHSHTIDEIDDERTQGRW